MKLAIFLGKIKILWTLFRPMLASRVGDFLLDARVRVLAVQAVERVTRWDLDGDGKHDHAVADLAAELKAIGIEYYRGWLSIAIEVAYRSVAG